MNRSKKHGFTLVELLVVIAVVGTLVSMLIPAVLRARNAANRTQCQSQLRQVAIALDHYMSGRGPRGQYPDADPLPVSHPSNPPFQSLVKVLGRYIEDNNAVFTCPDDIGDRPNPGDPPYYKAEGLSYEYNEPRLGGGKTRTQVLQGANGTILKSSTVPVAWDFEKNTHAPAGSAGARNIVFLDCHVED